MKFCEDHWEKLRAGIKARGLWDLVATSGQEAVAKLTEAQAGIKTENFDPLMCAHNAITGNALENGGFYLMMLKPDGTHYCPMCEAEAHNITGWIDRACDEAAQIAKKLQEKKE